VNQPKAAADAHARYDDERLNALFDVTLRAVRRRRVTRQVYSRKTNEVRDLYERHLGALNVLPDD
jgi:hypothetical protein